MLVIFIGPPGSGKGTQANRLCEHLSIAHLSTGDMFRAAIQEETELGLQAQQYMDRGELVPDQLVVEMVAEALRKAPYGDGCLLDGFPAPCHRRKPLIKSSPAKKSRSTWSWNWMSTMES